MPPDMYRNNLILSETDPNTGAPIIDPITGKTTPVKDPNGNYTILHGPTTSVAMGSNNGQSHYFKGIGNNVNIVNFYNSEDAALTAWEFNQLTKPDFAQGEVWKYTNDYLEAVDTYKKCIPDIDPVCTEPALPATVTSIFKLGVNKPPVPYNEQTKFDIMAYVIPARTEPLGQEDEIGGEITGISNMSGYTNSNQDHSAPFHGYYSEVSTKDKNQIIKRKQRATYWNLVLSDSLELGSANYTGLKNTIQ